MKNRINQGIGIFLDSATLLWMVFAAVLCSALLLEIALDGAALFARVPFWFLLRDSAMTPTGYLSIVALPALLSSLRVMKWVETYLVDLHVA